MRGPSCRRRRRWPSPPTPWGHGRRRRRRSSMHRRRSSLDLDRSVRRVAGLDSSAYHSRTSCTVGRVARRRRRPPRSARAGASLVAAAASARAWAASCRRAARSAEPAVKGDARADGDDAPDASSRLNGGASLAGAGPRSPRSATSGHRGRRPPSAPATLRRPRRRWPDDACRRTAALRSGDVAEGLGLPATRGGITGHRVVHVLAE